MSFIIDNGSFANDPAKITANLLRDQRASFEQNFIPIENQLLNQTTYANPGLVDQQVSQAVGDGNITRGQAMAFNQQSDAGGVAGKGGTSSNRVVSSNRGYVQTALDNAERTQQYQMEKYGMAPTAEQVQAANTTSNLNRSTSMVDASNRIRQRLQDRNNQIMFGMTSNYKNAAAAQGGGGA